MSYKNWEDIHAYNLEMFLIKVNCYFVKYKSYWRKKTHPRILFIDRT